MVEGWEGQTAEVPVVMIEYRSSKGMWESNYLEVVHYIMDDEVRVGDSSYYLAEFAEGQSHSCQCYRIAPPDLVRLRTMQDVHGGRWDPCERTPDGEGSDS